MITCASCKNKTSTDRCQAPALKGIIFCGKHAKVKTPRLWAVVVNADRHASVIQKLWKGYNVRRQISLAGPGAMKRSLCHNDEDIVTFESKNNVSPLDYFSFEETGKIWWFDVRSMLQYSLNNIIVTNPYTRQPLPIEAKERLRSIYLHRIRNNQPNSYSESNTKLTIQEHVSQNWIQLCKILELNAFIDITPRVFSTLNRIRYLVFLQLIHADMEAWAREHTLTSKRYLYLGSLRHTIKKIQRHPDFSSIVAAYYTSKLLLSILNDTNNPYPICFMIMSAIVRL